VFAGEGLVPVFGDPAHPAVPPVAGDGEQVLHAAASAASRPVRLLDSMAATRLTLCLARWTGPRWTDGPAVRSYPPPASLIKLGPVSTRLGHSHGHAPVIALRIAEISPADVGAAEPHRA